MARVGTPLALGNRSGRAYSGSAGSYARFALLAFWLASIPLTSLLRRRPKALIGVAAAMAAVQVVLLARFALNLWVA